MEASFYESHTDGKVKCVLCPNNCVISDGKSGICRIRTNIDGTLYADAYGEIVSLAIDPIEKKPLFHFYPGHKILSTGPNGCNFKCGFCQNSEISQKKVVTRYISPEELALLSTRDGSIGIAYTYTEPFIWFEYVRDTGKLVHKNGGVNVLVTNGYVNEAPLKELLPLIDAMNVDIKSMKPEFYSKICGGKLRDVLKTVEIASKSCHIEITNLVIPNYNDTEKDFEDLTDWIYSVNPLIPLHFSRYFPSYNFTEPPTEPKKLFEAYQIAKTKLNYVYVGNISIESCSDTFCSGCGSTLIKRDNYNTDLSGINKGKCSTCKNDADIIGI
jgi:pyruvate formate lyase activating enzyme